MHALDVYLKMYTKNVERHLRQQYGAVLSLHIAQLLLMLSYIYL